MSFGCLIAGFILLFNPVVHVVDILPDAIGFFLIAAALTKTSYYLGYMEKARELFIKLALVECVKFFSIVFIPNTSGTVKVLLAFVFGVAELLLFIPAVNSFFDGLGMVGMLYDGGDSIYRERYNGKKQRDALSYTKNGILFFYVFRVCATLLPELTELEMYDYLGEVKAIQNSLVYYKPAIYVILWIFTIIFGIKYIVRIVGYFGGLARDKALVSALDEKFTKDVLPRKTLFIAKNMKNALFIFAFSAGFDFLLSFDGVNVFVGVISSALLIVASVIVKKYISGAVCVIPVTAVRAALSIVNFVLQIRYFAEYEVEAVNWISTAYDQYYFMSTLIAIEKIIALVSVILFIIYVMKAVKYHLELFGVKTDTAQYSKKNRDLETYNAVGGKLLLASILAVINYTVEASHAYLAVDMTLATMIVSAVTIIYVAYLVYTVNVIDDMIYSKEIEIA